MLEDRDEGFVVGMELKRAAFELRLKMDDGRVSGEKFSVESGVGLLSGGEFGGEKGERLPVGVGPLLQNRGDVSGRGVGGEGEWKRRVGMGKKGGLS